MVTVQVKSLPQTTKVRRGVRRVAIDHHFGRATCSFLVRHCGKSHSLEENAAFQGDGC